MGISWTHEADAQLLVAIINVSKPKIDYEAVAQYIGKECTANAIHHRLRKIQAMAKAADGKDKSAPVTPVKPKKTASAKSTPASSVKKRKTPIKAKQEKFEDTDGDGDDSEEEMHLKKKIKADFDV